MRVPPRGAIVPRSLMPCVSEFCYLNLLAASILKAAQVMLPFGLVAWYG